MIHQEFGRRLAHIMIMRMARLAYGLNKVNMPTKPPVSSLAGYICPVFIAQATLFYTDILFNKQTPAFNQLAQMKPPERYLARKTHILPTLDQGSFPEHPPGKQPGASCQTAGCRRPPQPCADRHGRRPSCQNGRSQTANYCLQVRALTQGEYLGLPVANIE